MELKASNLLRDLDGTLAVSGVILSLILIAYLWMGIGRLVYSLTGVLALISCLLWLMIRKSHPLDFHFPESRHLTRAWATVFFVLWTLNIVSVGLRPELYERPLISFIFTVLMGGAIACEALSSPRRHRGFILAQIVLLGVTIAWSQLLIFPSLLGVDPYYHSALTAGILNTGYIPEGTTYSKLPLFHLLIAATSLIDDLSYKFAAMISVSLAQILCIPVFVYLIADRLFKNHHAGLVSALLVVIANHFISMAYWSIPNAFDAIFIPIVLYLIIVGLWGRSFRISLVFFGVLLSTIILTHTIAAMCMAILLFVVWGSLAYYSHFWDLRSRISDYLPLPIPILFTIAMFAWWSFASDTIGTLITLIRNGFSVDTLITTPLELRTFYAEIPIGEQLFNNLGILVFCAFSFIGIFYMISRKGSGLTFAMAWAVLAPVAIGFFSLISGRSVIEGRWWYFAEIFLSIPLAIAISAVATWKIKNPLSLYGFFFGVVVVLGSLMIMSPPATTDNLSFSPNSNVRFAPTEAELISLMTLTEIWDGRISSDTYYAGTQRFQYPQLSDFSENIYENDFSTLNDDIIFVRTAIVGRPFMLFSDLNKLDYDLNGRLDQLGYSRVYDSNAGDGYRWS